VYSGKKKASRPPYIQWRDAAVSSDLPPYAKYLVLYLTTFMNGGRDVAWPSQARIIAETGLSSATVNKYLGVLAEDGWLSRNRGGGRKNTRYTTSIPPGFRRAAMGAKSPTDGDFQQAMSPSDGDFQQAMSPSGGDFQQAMSPSDGDFQQAMSPSDGDFQQAMSPSDGELSLRETETNIQTNIQVNKTSTTARMRAREATLIDSKFQPDERDYELLARKGISRRFIDDQLAEFIAFWEESGAVSTTWRAKFRNRVTSEFFKSRGWSGSSRSSKSNRGSYETHGTGNRHESGLQRADRISFDGIKDPF
jgi:hypothetical protein